ncbi:MAG: restriction endonuclease subunit S [Chloroflexota bacterium]|nr:restriction endonuclease subunit S [Chloroflexota bacterium]
MSRIEDLIAKLCPDGVEFHALDEVFETRNGYTPSTTDASNWTNGTIPWFRMEDIRDNGRVLDDAMQHIAESAVKGGRLFPAHSIIVATSATIGEHALINVPFMSNQRFTALWPKPAFASRLNMKFVFYYCFVLDEWCRKNTTKSSFASVDMVGFKRFMFPTPPVEVQREIVQILDSFTSLQAELEDQLEAELEARRRQYAFYRDSLFTCREARVSRTAMGEIGRFVRGRRFTKDDIVEDGIPSIHYGEIYTHYGVSTTSTLSSVRLDLAKQLRYAEPGDVVIAAVGETVEDVGKAVAWLGDTNAAIHDDCFLFRHTLNPKYVAYFLQTDAFHSQKGKYVARAKVKRLSGENLAKIAIPFPPLEEQERIVSILDTFEALVNELSIKLRAELNARRKQYEYYRDRLLTFEELAI